MPDQSESTIDFESLWEQTQSDPIAVVPTDPDGTGELTAGEIVSLLRGVTGQLAADGLLDDAARDSLNACADAYETTMAAIDPDQLRASLAAVADPRD